MKILAVDIGTSMGFAWSFSGEVFAGTKLLATPKQLTYAKKLRMDRRLDIRIQTFVNWLEIGSQPDLLVWEDVRWASYQAQAHLWASFRGVLWSYAARRGIQTDCLDTSKLKLWTTGSGAADKPAMASAALRRWPELVKGKNYGDDAIDALCLLQFFKLNV